MISSWTILQDKENSVGFQPSKAAAGKSSQLESMQKKIVFGDVGNKIRSVDVKRDTFGSLKTPGKAARAVTKCDAVKNEVWPEPEFLQPCAPFEDDYEDCWPMDLRLSKRCMQSLGDYRGKGKKPMPKHIEDSPLPTRCFHVEDDIDLELFLEPVVDDILPPDWEL